MAASSTPILHIADEFKPLFEQIGFTPEMIFTSPQIKPWRKLSDRENCVWDIQTPVGETRRLHVKRFPAHKPAITSARDEATGYGLLKSKQIPTAELVAWGVLPAGLSFIAMADLAGYTPADKLVELGTPFETLLAPTALLTARLHNAGLHHRDLYLCHYLAKVGPASVDLRLIDAARVRPLPTLFRRRRWIIKDLAQFWFSTMALPITEAQRRAWLSMYAEETQPADVEDLRRAIERKSQSIAAHDVNLRRKQPHRNISIPE